MLYPDLVVNSTYKVVREIGAGGMGVVYLAYHLRLDKYIVMKKIKNSSASLSVIRNEADVLKSLHHTYLPQVYDFIQYDGDTYTIIDYIDLGNYALPKFQRGYVWNRDQVRKMMNSLYRGYPIGGLLIWETAVKILFWGFSKSMSLTKSKVCLLFFCLNSTLRPLRIKL